MTDPRPLDALLAGLTCSILEGRVELDGPIPVGEMATAPLRGLSGWLVLERFPSVAATCFKPGQGGNQPPGYVFQLKNPQAGRQTAFDFRCISWDRGHRLADVLCAVWPTAAGRPFGQGQSRIRTIQVLGRRDGALSEVSPAQPAGPICITLATPVLIKNGALGWLGPESLTPRHLAAAAARRLNALSQHYGSGQQVDVASLSELADDLSVTHSELRWSSPERRSAVQGNVIKLSGVRGSIQVARLPQPLATLFSAATLVHLGKHACDGCGRLTLAPSDARMDA